MEGTLNLKALFFAWWYKEGFKKILNYIKRYFAYIYDQFSVQICVTTLFSVWRGDAQSAAYGSTMNDRFQAFLFTQVSRFIGFIVKSSVLIIYLGVLFFSFMFFGIFMLVWLFFPLVILLVFLYGVGLLIGLL